MGHDARELSQTLASESFPGGWGEFRTTAVGAILSNGLTHSTPINVVGDWKAVSFEFVADAPTAEVECRIGFYGSTLIGAISCDDIAIAWVP